MAEVTTPKKTLGLTGLTSNAMALIAPGAFLWLTFAEQTQYGAPGAGMSMWLGIVAALLLCLATAVSYAELSKLYPGAGSSYFFAEQAFLSKKQAYKWARIAKFMVGWASHLYYWVYPGVMVGVTALLVGYVMGQVFPTTFDSAYPSPIFMFGFCVFFALFVAYIAFRGVGGTTGVNAVINVIQIAALLVFSVMAIAHRIENKEGANVYNFTSAGTTTRYVQDTTKDSSLPPIWVQVALDSSGKMIPGPDGKPIVVPTDAYGNLPAVLPPGVTKVGPEPFLVSYQGGITKDDKGVETYQYPPNAVSVIAPHKFSYIMIQAGVAILILVGFESVTAMGEEARNARRDIPKAVILSLLIQGGFCYLLEYFAANYFMSNAYGAAANASSSAAPIGDMMQLVGAWAFGSPRAGWWFMMIQAVTVFLALIGTTLSCLATGARVTYAMGRDNEVAGHFGRLHHKHASPHAAVWTLAIISAVLGCATVATYLCGPGTGGSEAAYKSTLAGIPDNFWYKVGTHHLSYEKASKLPQSLLTITLISNFGTFMLYMMSCWVAVVAFHQHHLHNLIRHKIIPIFGLLANLACMIFYIVGPKFVAGMSATEPYVALGVAAVWGLYGAFHFMIGSKKKGKPIIISSPPVTA